MGNHTTFRVSGQCDDEHLKQALIYASRGLRVVPLWTVEKGICKCSKGAGCKDQGKHPRTRHGEKDATTDEKTIRSWRWATANIGIATGSESGLVVVDIDPRNDGDKTMHSLITSLGQPPRCPKVRTGGGGWHLYFRHPGGVIPSSNAVARGIDIKGDNGLVVAPPSVHKNGPTYQWERGLQEFPLPALPPKWLEWLQKAVVTQTAQTEQTFQTVQTEQTGKDTRRAGSPLATMFAASDRQKEFIDRCIERTLPEKPGTRHVQVFKLKKLLLGDPELAKLPLIKLRPIVDIWYEMAAETLKGAVNATVDENWWDFAEGEVLYPGEDGLMTTLLDRVKTNPLPEIANYYKTEQARLLVGLCRQLQKMRGDQPFFLSTPTVARLFGLDEDKDRMRVWRWLDGLVRDGVLELVEKGDRRRASSFRYLGD